MAKLGSAAVGKLDEHHLLSQEGGQIEHHSLQLGWISKQSARKARPWDSGWERDGASTKFPVGTRK